jgi:hypothetical protein
MGRSEAGLRGVWRGLVPAILLAVGLALAATTATAAGTARFSEARPGSTHALALAGLRGRKLLQPECTPMKGPGWVYPIGPPVRGLTPIVANIKSDLYEVFAINYPCRRAAAWIRKLDTLKIPIKHSGNATVLKGPKGYYCSAWPDANGHAYAGGCQAKGGGGCVVSPKNSYGRQYRNGEGCKLTGGKKAFGWNWNVANRRVVFAHDDKGVLHLIHLSGADTNVLFRYLKGKYQLQVLNTSGIGWLNGFTWTPSPGWKVTKIKNVSGGHCSRTAGGKIACKGTVHPPSCLCNGDGGMVSVTFTAAPTKKHAGYLFGGSPWQFKVTKMTPVPYLIPGTPDEAQKRDGV